MRRVLFFLQFVLFFRIGYSQGLAGTVLDLATGKPIENAIVYFSGTFTGTYTEKNGMFYIRIPENISGPLTVSSIGYYSVSVSDIGTGKRLLIYLNPKVYELKEVVVSAHQKESQGVRRENLEMFKNEFLGNTYNAYRCRIENEDEIIFEWKPDSMILRAFCSGPIQIDNRALGYKVSYYLDVFRYNASDHSLTIAGNIIFKEDVSDKKKKVIENRRQSAYLGSRMHFFRELWEDNLDSSGFQVKTIRNNILNYKDLVAECEDGNKYLKTKEDLSIRYFSKYGGSRLTLTKDSVLFEKDGYYNALEVALWGEIGRLRVADWLPYEYSITEGSE